jgi:phosphatidylinositol alpha-1,6-mannosyltransferase
MNHTRKRILVITELFLPTKGGTAVWFDEVYRRIGGKEIHIVTADVPGARDHDVNHPNSVHRLQLRRYAWVKPESLVMYLKLFIVSLRLAFRHRFDAVHAGRVLPEGFAGWLVARLTGLPLVIYAHGEEITTWRQSGKFRAMRFAYRHADKVIANSEFTRGELRKLGVREEAITIISPGVDIEKFRPELPTTDLTRRIGLEPGQKLILSVGRLSRRKGFDQVIRSIPKLLEKHLDVRYAIIGIGDDYEYLRNLARQCGVDDRVHLLGHVAMEDLPRWYNACTVFAMPNRDIDGDTEGFGMVYLEAAACGKTSLCGRAGGTGAAVIDGVTGFRVDGEALDEITQALERLLTDAPAAGLAKAAYDRVTSEYSWQRVAEKTLAV